MDLFRLANKSKWINFAAWFKTKAKITLLGEPTKFNTNEQA